MYNFIDQTSNLIGTPVNRKAMMALQNFFPTSTVVNNDGSIVETNDDGDTLTTVFNQDETVTETFVANVNYGMVLEILSIDTAEHVYGFVRKVGTKIKFDLSNAYNYIPGYSYRVMAITSGFVPIADVAQGTIANNTKGEITLFSSSYASDSMVYVAFYNTEQAYIGSWEKTLGSMETLTLIKTTTISGNNMTEVLA